MINKETIQLKALSSAIETVKRPGFNQAKTEKESGDVAETRDENRYVVRIKVFNPESRTLYAYGEARRIRYDSASGKLILGLHDGHLDEDSINAIHMRRPRFVSLEANTETEIKLALPKVINRIRSAAERAGGPISEQLNISEAKEIEVEIAHQDTPFYYNPKVSMAKQLKEWGSAVTKAKYRVDSSPKTKK